MMDDNDIGPPAASPPSRPGPGHRIPPRPHQAAPQPAAGGRRQAAAPGGQGAQGPQGAAGGKSEFLMLRVLVPTKSIDMSMTKRFRKNITIREAVEICKSSLKPCLLPLVFHMFSEEGQKYDDNGTLTNYGLGNMDTLLMKPESEADVEKSLRAEEEPKKPAPDATTILQGYVKSGYLLKRKSSSKLSMGAKRQWCVLKDSFLHVFANPRDREPDCSFDLERCLIKFAESWESRADGRVELMRLVSKSKSYTFTAESEADARSWYEAMAARRSSESSDYLERIRKASVSGYVTRRYRGLGQAQRRCWAVLCGSGLYFHESPAAHEALQIVELFSTKTVLNSERCEIQITEIGVEPFVLTFETEGEYAEWAKHMRAAASVSVTDSREIDAGLEDISTGYIKAGYMLKKKTSRRFSSTKRRWFVLKANRLYYTHLQTDPAALGFFDLLHTQANFYLLDEEDEGAEGAAGQQQGAGRGEAQLELITIGGVYVLKHPEADDAELREWCEAIKVQCVGVPFNVVHKQHVDFDYNWYGENPSEIFEFQERMGEGAYATVHRAKHTDTRFELAIKILHSEDSVMMQSLQQEIDVLKRCRSPQIVCYYGTCSVSGQLWILTELCGCGSVKDMMKMTLETLSEPQLAYVVSETLKGLAYLHSMNIIHHDIKAGNILLTDEAQVKLADFGVSQQYKDMRDIRADDFIGSPLYMSPEIIRKSSYNNKADIWSLGITIIEMAEGSPPNTHVTNFEQLLKITQQAPPTLQHRTQWSADLNDFIARCLTADTELRPDTIDLLLHSFTRQSRGKDVIRGLVNQCMGIRTKQRERRATSEKPPALPKRPIPGGDGGAGGAPGKRQ